MNTTEAQVLVESGFYESQTCAVLYPKHGHKIDYFGLDLAFRYADNANQDAPRNLCFVCQHFGFTSWYLLGEKFRKRLPRDWYLGLWKDVRKQSYCALCGLVSNVVRINLGSEDMVGISRAMVRLVRHGKRGNDAMTSIPGHMIVQLSLRDSFNWERSVRFRYNHHIHFAEEQGLTYSQIPNDWKVDREIPQQLNIGLVKSWMAMCDSEHNSQFRDSGFFGFYGKPHNLKVLDVESLHVIDATLECRYLALSYVWGSFKIPQYQIIISEGRTERDFAPVFDELPLTIRDAIKLVQELGERFLWTDTLCINQNDPDEKDQQVAQMGKIYASAVLTVISRADDKKYQKCFRRMQGLRRGSMASRKHPHRPAMG